MKVEVESLDRVRKSIEVILDEEKVNELREGIFEELKKRANIKGFRPGKVPRSVMQAYYKDYVDDELKRKMVEETMGNALSETHVEPVSEPHIHFLETEDQYGYKMECEVAPEFDLPDYEAIEAEATKIAVSDEDMTKRIDAMRQMHSELIDRESQEPAQKGDLVMVQYEGFRDGQPVKGVKADSYPIDLGGSNLTPEFETGLTGMKVGEEKDIAISFPADYPDKDIAGKDITFKVLVKEIKEKRLPDINDEFAKDVGFENVDGLNSEVRRELEKEQESQRKNAITEQIIRFLLDKTDLPVPARLLQKRSEMMVQDARSRMKTGTLSDEDERSFNAALVKQYEPEAEKRIKVGMILEKIAEREGIKVEDNEVDERLKKIAEETKRAYDYIREFYDKYDLTGNLRSSIIEEKTINLLIEKAVVKEK
jgi:trigger factor